MNILSLFRKNYELLHNDKNPYDNINQLSILRIWILSIEIYSIGLNDIYDHWAHLEVLFQVDTMIYEQ